MGWLKSLMVGFTCLMLPLKSWAHGGGAHLHPHGSESMIILGAVVVTVISLLIWQWQKH